MTSQTINLNLIPQGVPPVVHVSQYDKGQEWNIYLFENGVLFTIPSGTTALMQGTKPDKRGFQYPATVDTTNNVVTFTLEQQMAAVGGNVKCELVLTNGDSQIATINFILDVEPAALSDDTVISDTELPLIEQAATEAAAQAAASAAAAAASAAAAQAAVVTDMAGATAQEGGAHGLVPAPAAGDNTKFLSGGGTWEAVHADFSTSEVATGTHWIDGLPIYRKVMAWGALPANTSPVSKPHGISNLNDIVDIRGIYKTSAPLFGSIPIVNPTPEYQVGAWADRTNLTVQSGSNRSTQTAWFIIEYTKTTD